MLISVPIRLNERANHRRRLSSGVTICRCTPPDLIHRGSLSVGYYLGILRLAQYEPFKAYVAAYQTHTSGTAGPHENCCAAAKDPRAYGYEWMS